MVHYNRCDLQSYGLKEGRKRSQIKRTLIYGQGKVLSPFEMFVVTMKSCSFCSVTEGRKNGEGEREDFSYSDLRFLSILSTSLSLKTTMSEDRILLVSMHRWIAS